MDVEQQLLTLYKCSDLPLFFFQELLLRLIEDPTHAKDVLKRVSMHVKQPYLPIHDVLKSVSVCMSSDIRVTIEQIRSNIHRMVGDEVCKASHYEGFFCDVLGWNMVDDRYYDAYNGLHYIEMKKGQSLMWFDLVRYAEIYLNIGRQGTITLFIQYDKRVKCVKEVYVIYTTRLMKFLNMSKSVARQCMKLYKLQTRRLNMQASATKLDMKKMAFCVINNPHFPNKR